MQLDHDLLYIQPDVEIGLRADGEIGPNEAKLHVGEQRFVAVHPIQAAQGCPYGLGGRLGDKAKQPAEEIIDVDRGPEQGVGGREVKREVRQVAIDRADVVGAAVKGIQKIPAD